MGSGMPRASMDYLCVECIALISVLHVSYYGGAEMSFL